MPLSIQQSSVAAYQAGLSALLGVIDKASAYAETAKFDPAIYMTMRLRPDMLPFPFQVQNCCDHAKNGTARLAGLDAPRFEDNEKTLDELKARIERTLSFIGGAPVDALEQGAEREIVIPVGGGRKGKMRGGDYLVHFALPSFYFHLTTAYDLLRYAGVDIGKRDFLGRPPGLELI